MGYILHHAIIVTTWDKQKIEAAAAEALNLGALVIGPSGINEKVMNSYQTILVCPDGSKEGWDASFNGDAIRADFKEWLKARRWEDGSNSFEWCEVAYGSDDKEARITDSEWKEPPHERS